MLRMGKETDLSPEEVVKKAIAFFGEGGVGLEVGRQTDRAVEFRGADGHVLVQVEPKNGRFDVDVQTREWEYDVKKFMQQI